MTIINERMRKKVYEVRYEKMPSSKAGSSLACPRNREKAGVVKGGKKKGRSKIRLGKRQSVDHSGLCRLE